MINENKTKYEKFAHKDRKRVKCPSFSFFNELFNTILTILLPFEN